MIKILLADDHSIVRSGIRNLLEKEPDISVVAEATSGAEVAHLLTIHKPHILIADLKMPDAGGIELAGQLKLSGNPAKVMVLTAHDHLDFVSKAFSSGVSAYLFKNVSPEELVFAVRQVYHGNQYLCNELSLRLLDQNLNKPNPDFSTKEQPVSFSERELEVLKLIAAGDTNQEIADKLFTSKRTIEGYRRAMIANTGVKNTAALIRYVVKQMLID